MKTLVNLTGDFSVEDLKRIAQEAQILANQPPLKVYERYSNENPKITCRKIFVSAEGSKEYYVKDIGCIINVPNIVALGSKIYSEEEVEKLKQG